MEQIVPTDSITSGNFLSPEKKREEVVPTSSIGEMVVPTESISDPVEEQGSPQTDVEKHKKWYQVLNGNIERTYLAGFNEQVADMLQTPISAGLELYQMGFGGDVNPNLPGYDPDDHVGGTRAVKDLFEAVGINVTPEEDSLGARIGEETAIGLTALAPMGAAANAAKYSYGYLQPIISFVAKRPIAAVLTDVGISIPAGTGGYYGEKVGGEIGKALGDRYQLVGEKAGSETGEALGVIAGSLSPYPAKWAISPFTSLGAATGRGLKKGYQSLGLGQEAKAKRAAEIFREHLSTESAGKLRSGDIDTPTVGEYTTAELLNDKSLLELQSSVAARSPDARNVADLSRRGTEQALAEKLAELHPGEVGPTSYVRDRITSAARAVQKRMESAVARAQARINQLSSNSPIDVIEKIAREEFDAVYKTARQGERSVWSKVGDGTYKTDTIIQRAKEIVAETPRLSGEGGKPDVPLAIREIAGQDAVIHPETGAVVKEEVASILKGVETEKEIQALVSRIGQDVRIARSEGRLNTARMLGQLRDSIFQKIMPVSGGSAELDAARAYSRRLNEVFYHGPLGQLLQQNAKGGLKVAPELTLERMIGAGTKGKLGAQSLRSAAGEYGGAEKVDAIIQEYLVAKFTSKAFTGGAFNPNAANSFVNSHNALELYPQLRGQMLDAAKAETLARSVSKSRQALIKRIENQSLAYKFLEGREPQAAINAILKSPHPIRDVRSLVTLAKKDPSGNTIKGLRSAFYEILSDRFGKTVGGEYQLTPNNMKHFLDNSTHKELIKSVFGKDSLKLLNEVLKGASFKSRSYGASHPQLEMKSSAFEKLLGAGGTLGALFGGMMSKVGAGYTGKGLIMSGIGRRGARGFLNSVANASREDVYRILEEAINNPAFARELIKPLNVSMSPKGQMSLRKFAIFNELFGGTPDAVFAFSEELMP